MLVESYMVQTKSNLINVSVEELKNYKVWSRVYRPKIVHEYLAKITNDNPYLIPSYCNSQIELYE